jgi:hypothetical protein
MSAVHLSTWVSQIHGESRRWHSLWLFKKCDVLKAGDRLKADNAASSFKFSPVKNG